MANVGGLDDVPLHRGRERKDDLGCADRIVVGQAVTASRCLLFGL